MNSYSLGGTLKLKTELEVTKLITSGKLQTGNANILRNAALPILGGIGISVASFAKLSTSITQVTQHFENLVKPIDDITSKLNRIRVGTGENFSNNTLMNYMTGMANEARSTFDIIANVASRLTFLRDDINLPTATRLASLMSKSGFLGGSADSEVRSTILQLLQGIGSNQLGGDELRSLRENAPGLIKYMAMGLRRLYEEDPTKYSAFKNANSGNIKSLGEQKLLTGDVVVNALLKVGDTIDKDFKSLKLTTTQQLNQIQNNITKAYYNDGFVSALAPINKVINSIYEYTAKDNGKALLNKVTEISGLIQNGLNSVISIVGAYGKAANFALGVGGGYPAKYAMSYFAASNLLVKPLLATMSGAAGGVSKFADTYLDRLSPYSYNAKNNGFFVSRYTTGDYQLLTTTAKELANVKTAAGLRKLQTSVNRTTKDIQAFATANRKNGFSYLGKDTQAALKHLKIGDSQSLLDLAGNYKKYSGLSTATASLSSFLMNPIVGIAASSLAAGVSMISSEIQSNYQNMAQWGQGSYNTLQSIRSATTGIANSLMGFKGMTGYTRLNDGWYAGSGIFKYADIIPDIMKARGYEATTTETLLKTISSITASENGMSFLKRVDKDLASTLLGVRYGGLDENGNEMWNIINGWRDPIKNIITSREAEGGRYGLTKSEADLFDKISNTFFGSSGTNYAQYLASSESEALQNLASTGYQKLESLTNALDENTNAVKTNYNKQKVDYMKNVMGWYTDKKVTGNSPLSIGNIQVTVSTPLNGNNAAAAASEFAKQLAIATQNNVKIGVGKGPGE